MRFANTALLEPPPASAESASWAELDYVLTVACVYQDESAREWARQVCARVSPSAGPEAVRLTDWNISDLADPRVLAEAVSRAAGADVIVVAIHAADGLPDDLCVWVIAWLRRRPRVTGALVALIGLPEQPGAPSHGPQEYLRAVAHASAMDFFIADRKLPPASPDLFEMGAIAGQKVEG